MNTDFSYCSGFLPNKFSCPLKDKCCRYLEAVTGDPLWWTEAAFDGERCPNFINRMTKKRLKRLLRRAEDAL